METKEIEKRIADAIKNIPLKEELEKSRDNLKIKMERYEKYKVNPYTRMKRRLKAVTLYRAKKEGLVLSVIHKLLGN